MAYRYQVLDARNSLQIKSVAGICTDGDDFISALNEITERLLDRGNWFDTEQVMHLCAYNGCLTWPRQVGTVLGIRLHCGGEIDIRNNWWSISGPRGHCGDFLFDHTARDNGMGPCFNEITGTAGKEIRVFATKDTDYGKTVTLYGFDSNNQPLQQKINGVWQRGITIQINRPYGTSFPILVNKITSATKDLTQANVLVFEYDSVSQTMRDLALWEPSETNPRYRRQIINNFNWMAGCPTTDPNPNLKIHKFDAMVKLAYIPASSDLDFLLIDDFTALKFMFQALRLEEANQDAAAQQKIDKAIQQLNFRDRNLTPYEQTVVKVNPLGISVWNPI